MAEKIKKSKSRADYKVLEKKEEESSAGQSKLKKPAVQKKSMPIPEPIQEIAGENGGGNGDVDVLKEEAQRKAEKVKRMEVERALHSQIRLQSPEELLKRVDTGFGQKARAPFQAVVEGVQNSIDAIDKAREALKKSSGSDDYEAEIKIGVKVLDPSRGEIYISIEDNGIGIPKKKVPIIMRAGGTGTMEYKASRSQQGIGWTAAAMYANRSTGKPVEVLTKTFSERKAHKHLYDYSRGEVKELFCEDYLDGFRAHGTKMSIHLLGDFARAKGNIMEFIKRVAGVHPYITFILKLNGDVIEYRKRSTKGIPIPSPVPPHPNSIDVGQLKDLITSFAGRGKRAFWLHGFLKRAFCRIGNKSVNEIVERAAILNYFDSKNIFAGEIIKKISESEKVNSLRKDRGELITYLKTLVREAEISYSFAAELVMNGRLRKGANIRSLDSEELKKLFRLDHKTIDGKEMIKPAFDRKTRINEILNDEKKLRLLNDALRSMFFPAPPIDSLMPIPQEVLIEGFTTQYNVEKFFYSERKPTSTEGRPLQVQVLGMYLANGAAAGATGIATAPTTSPVLMQEKIIRIANCTPLIYEFGSDIITQTAKEIDWPRYKLGRKGELPENAIFVVHVTSPQLKYLGVAKQAIGADDVIAMEVKLALQSSARELMSHVNRMEHDKRAEYDRKYLENYASVLTYSISKSLKVDRDRLYGMLMNEINKRRPKHEEHNEETNEQNEQQTQVQS